MTIVDYYYVQCITCSKPLNGKSFSINKISKHNTLTVSICESCFSRILGFSSLEEGCKKLYEHEATCNDIINNYPLYRLTFSLEDRNNEFYLKRGLGSLLFCSQGNSFFELDTVSKEKKIGTLHSNQRIVFK